MEDVQRMNRERTQRKIKEYTDIIKTKIKE